MNATNDGTTLDHTAAAFRPPIKGEWTRNREMVRDICVERARAVFLAARWLHLFETAADSAGRALEETARVELKIGVRRYTRLLLEFGETRSTALLLVAELATEVARQQAGDPAFADELRDELIEWVLDVTPLAPSVHRKRSTAIAD